LISYKQDIVAWLTQHILHRKFIQIQASAEYKITIMFCNSVLHALTLNIYRYVAVVLIQM